MTMLLKVVALATFEIQSKIKRQNDFNYFLGYPFKRQHTKAIRRQLPINCLSVFDILWGWSLKV